MGFKSRVDTKYEGIILLPFASRIGLMYMYVVGVGGGGEEEWVLLNIIKQNSLFLYS